MTPPEYAASNYYIEKAGHIYRVTPPAQTASNCDIQKTALIPALLPIFHDFGTFDALHEFLDAGDGFPGIQALGTRFRAVEDGVTAIDGIMILKSLHSLFRLLVARVDHPAVGLHQHRRPQISVPVPPVRGTRGRAARAQDALVHAVQFSAVLH